MIYIICDCSTLVIAIFMTTCKCTCMDKIYVNDLPGHNIVMIRRHRMVKAQSNYIRDFSLWNNIRPPLGLSKILVQALKPVYV